MKILISTAYFPPIEFFHHVVKSPEFFLENHEHYLKQTYRNRCCILGANGKLNLTVTIEKYNNNSPVKDIRISYREHWQSQHWRSIVSAYNSSPFFLYYDYQLEPLFSKKHTFLWDLNLEIIHKLFSLLKIQPVISHSQSYIKDYPFENNDLRQIISPKSGHNYSSKIYPQVFDQKIGFVPNLSILDLLFNTGPEWKKYT